MKAPPGRSPGNRLDSLRESAFSEMVCAVCVMAGSGALPLLYAALGGHFWVVQAAAGLLAACAGQYALERQTRRLVPFLTGFPAALARLARLLFRTVRRQPDLAPSVEPEQPSDPVTEEKTANQDWFLPSLELATGLVIIFAAILAGALHALGVSRPDPVVASVYFSSPALLVWLLGELAYLLPRITVTPWNGAAFLAVLKSGLKALAGALVVAYLALWMGGREATGLFWGAAGLALASLAFGMIVGALERSREKDHRQPGSEQVG